MHVHACGRNLVGCGWIGRALVLVKNRLSIVLQASKHHQQQQEQHPPFSPLPTPAQSPIACVGCVTQETQFMGCEGGAVSFPTSRPRDALYDTSLFLRKQVAPRCHHDLPIAFTVQHSISHSFLPPPPSLTLTSITNHRLFIGMIKE